jgi:hypothetical protein
MPTLDDGQRAVEQGNLQQARLIFEAILQETPRSEEAWMGLAEVLTDSSDKRICYENVLKINKNNRAAREALRNLEPQENPFVAQLGQRPPPREGEEEFMVEEGDEDEVPIPAPYIDDSSADSDGPPTAALVIVGLLLSVVIFALGGGLAFFVLTSLTSS